MVGTKECAAAAVTSSFVVPCFGPHDDLVKSRSAKYLILAAYDKEGDSITEYFNGSSVAQFDDRHSVTNTILVHPR
jgi:hypothetical protein